MKYKVSKNFKFECRLPTAGRKFETNSNDPLQMLRILWGSPKSKYFKQKNLFQE